MQEGQPTMKKKTKKTGLKKVTMADLKKVKGGKDTTPPPPHSDPKPRHNF